MKSLFLGLLIFFSTQLAYAIQVRTVNQLPDRFFALYSASDGEEFRVSMTADEYRHLAEPGAGLPDKSAQLPPDKTWTFRHAEQGPFFSTATGNLIDGDVCIGDLFIFIKFKGELFPLPREQYRLILGTKGPTLVPQHPEFNLKNGDLL